MEYLIAIAALVIAIIAQARINTLSEENRTLRHMLEQFFMNRQPPSDNTAQQQQPVPQPRPMSPQQPAPQARPQYVPPQQPQYVPQPVVQRDQRDQKEPKEPKSMESVFGKNVIGVIAAVLMFIGIFAFGTLVIKSLTDLFIIIGMFLFSGAVLTIGLILNKKKKTSFRKLLPDAVSVWCTYQFL